MKAEVWVLWISIASFFRYQQMDFIKIIPVTNQLAWLSVAQEDTLTQELINYTAWKVYKITVECGVH